MVTVNFEQRAGKKQPVPDGMGALATELFQLAEIDGEFTARLSNKENGSSGHQGITGVSIRNFDKGTRQLVMRLQPGSNDTCWKVYVTIPRGTDGHKIRKQLLQAVKEAKDGNAATQPPTSQPPSEAGRLTDQMLRIFDSEGTDLVAAFRLLPFTWTDPSAVGGLRYNREAGLAGLMTADQISLFFDGVCEIGVLSVVAGSGKTLNEKVFSINTALHQQILAELEQREPATPDPMPEQPASDSLQNEGPEDNIQFYEDIINSATAGLERVDTDIKTLDDKAYTLKQEHDRLRHERDALPLKLAEMRKKKAQLQRELADLNQEIPALTLRQRQIVTALSSTSTELAEVTGKVAELAAKRATLQADLAEAQQELDKERRRLDEAAKQAVRQLDAQALLNALDPEQLQALLALATKQ